MRQHHKPHPKGAIMKFRNILLLICAVFLIGCDTTPPTDTPDTPTGTITELKDIGAADADMTLIRSYTAQSVEIPKDFPISRFGTKDFYVEDGKLCVITGYSNAKDESVCAVLQYDTEGELAACIEVPQFRGGNELDFRPLSDGTFLYFGMTDRGFTQSRVFIGDAQRNVLQETLLSAYSMGMGQTGVGRFTSMHVTENEDGTRRIFINAYDKAYYLDESLNILNTVEVPGEYAGVHKEADGVYLLGSQIPGMVRMDMNAGTSEIVDSLVPDVHLTDAAVYTLGPDGTVYYVEYGVLYRVDENGKSKELFKWKNGKYDGKGAFRCLSEDVIYYKPDASQNILATTPQIVRIQPQHEDEAVKRHVLTLANLGIGNSNWLTELVRTFNAENETYFVDVVDFFVTENAQSYALYDDWMLEKGTPDMVLLYSPGLGKRYEDMGLFVDLAPFFGDRLLGAASGAFTNSDGTQYILPLSLSSIETYAAASSVLDRPLTWGDMEAFGAEIAAVGGVTEYITSHTQAYTLFEQSLYDFVDFDAKTATFDSPEFIRRIQFLEEFEERYGTDDLGRFASNAYMYTINGGDAIFDAVKTGEVRLLHARIRNLEGYAALKQFFADTPFTLCGYPTTDGAAAQVVINSDFNLALYEDSALLGGCAAFIEFALSDAVQTSPALTGASANPIIDIYPSMSLPVTSSAVRKVLEDYRYLYYDDPYPVYTSEKNGVVIPDFVLASFAHASEPIEEQQALRREVILTDEEIDTFAAFLENCTARSAFDQTIRSIVEEELSSYQSGAKTLEEASKLIQSRVFIYLNE